MEYTINKLSKLAGISTRSLRYYDEIDLLKPNRINESGYRIYGTKEVDILQQILFYKSLGVSLSEIKSIIRDENFDAVASLKHHYQELLLQREQLENLILTVQKTIKAKEGKIKMTDQEKFEALKKDYIKKNEENYGAEIRERYGDKTIDDSNNKIKGMSQDAFNKTKELENKVNSAIKKALENGDPHGELAIQACQLHKEWIMCYWKTYSKEGHLGLAKMYVEDPRFKEYYENVAKGAAEFFLCAMENYITL